MRQYFMWEDAEAGHAEMTDSVWSEMQAAQVRTTKAWEQMYAQLKA